MNLLSHVHQAMRSTAFCIYPHVLLHCLLMMHLNSLGTTMSHVYSRYVCRAHRFLVMSCIAVVMTGCAATGPHNISIYDAALGAVFLEHVSDTSYQAAHPIKLPETTVADLLRGVHTKEKTGLLLLLGKALRSTNLNDIRTFSEDDIAFLTPHITTALAQATPHQRVGFHIYSMPTISQSPKANQQQETTSGYLFADGLSLHFTLTQYQYRAGKPSTSSQKEPRALPDTDGLRDREVTFLPEGAVRPDAYDRSSWIGKSQDKSLAIDYQLLTRILSAPQQPVPAVAVPTGQPPQAAPTYTAPVGRQDADMQAFKEELRALQKKLDEQNAELQRLKNLPARQ
jgi:hypothetical protein